MIIDRNLAASVRAALARTDAVREVKMFGGIGFMLNGNLFAAASKRGLLVRVPDLFHVVAGADGELFAYAWGHDGSLLVVAAQEGVRRVAWPAWADATSSWWALR